MPFNIADFNSEIATTGIASTSHFEAWILGGPGSHYGISGILQEYGMTDGMRFRIEAVNMPGRQLLTLDQNYYGPMRRIPYRTAQLPLTLSVILSKDMREREIFMKWQDYFAGHYRTNTNRSGIPGMFDGKYYQDGIGTIAILQLSQPIGTDLLTLARIGSQVIPKFFNPNQNVGRNLSAGTQIASKVLRFFDQPSFQIQNTITLVEAYPLTVNDIQLSWADEGYAKMTVEIQYRYTIEDNANFGDGGNLERERKNRVL